MSLERGFAHIPQQPSRPPRPVERQATNELPGPIQIAAQYANIRIKNPELSFEEAKLATMRALNLPRSTAPMVEKAILANRRMGFGSYSSRRRLGYPYEKDDESE